LLDSDANPSQPPPLSGWKRLWQKIKRPAARR
jgi:hypothetical protein